MLLRTILAIIAVAPATPAASAAISSTATPTASAAIAVAAIVAIEFASGTISDFAAFLDIDDIGLRLDGFSLRRLDLLDRTSGILALAGLDGSIAIVDFESLLLAGWAAAGIAPAAALIAISSPASAATSAAATFIPALARSARRTRVELRGVWDRLRGRQVRQDDEPIAGVVKLQPLLIEAERWIGAHGNLLLRFRFEARQR